MKLGEIARALSATLSGNPEIEIRRVVHPLDAKGPGDLVLALSKEAATINGVRGGAIVIRPDTEKPTDGRGILVFDGHERMALALLTRLLDPGPARFAPAIHPTAVVAPDARMGAGVTVGPNAVVGAGTRIGDRTIILANVSIGADVVIGDTCTMHPGVVIGDRVQIGDRVIIQSNAVIGSDGFSFLPVRNPDGSSGPEARPVRIHSLGTVIIGDDVEIGAGTTIDRATLRATRIGSGTKIDNLVQIGHNVSIGENCIICGAVGIAGSVTVGDRAILGGAAGIADHLTIGPDSIVGPMAGVGRNVLPEEVVFGMPALPRGVFMERHLQVGRLKGLRQQVTELSQRLEALEKGGSDAGKDLGSDR